MWSSRDLLCLAMGVFSFLGRVFFASIFILSAWQMFNKFGVDGGPAVKELIPKLTVVKEHLSSKLGVAVPDIDARHVGATLIAVQGIGGFLFLFGSSFGTYLLLAYLAVTAPLFYDFYNYNSDQPEFGSLLSDFIEYLALNGALIYIIELKNSFPKREIKKTTNKTKTA